METKRKVKNKLKNHCIMIYALQFRPLVEVAVDGRHIAHVFLFFLGWHNRGAIRQGTIAPVVIPPASCGVGCAQGGREAEEG